MITRLLLISLISLVLIGCGGAGGGDSDSGTVDLDANIPERHRIKGGTPIFSLGGGGRLRGVQTDDEEYREYLLWKEWQEYQNYLKWQKTQQQRDGSSESGSESQ